MKPDRLPWFRFYTADWRGDAGLRRVGFAARGLWMDMLSLMHEATPCGHLLINGQPLDAASLAEVVGGKAKEVQALLERLEQAGVFSRTEDGVIFSRRMVRDSEKAKRDRDNGRGGGNPALVGAVEDNPSVNEGVNPQDKAHVGAAPASSETRKKEPVPDGTGAEAAPQEPTAKGLLWSEGVPAVERLTRKSRDESASLVGHLLKNVGGDHAKVLAMIRRCVAEAPFDAQPWLVAASLERPRVVPRRPARNGALELILQARERGASIRPVLDEISTEEMGHG